MTGRRNDGGARRGNPTVTARSMRKFIDHLSGTANVTEASRVAGFNRKTAYDLRGKHEDFAKAWDDAIEQATDALAAEARRRAMEGVEDVIVSMGRVVKDENGNPLMRRIYSDGLMTLLLKAHAPAKFNAAPVAPRDAELPTDLMPDPLPIPDEPGPTG